MCVLCTTTACPPQSRLIRNTNRLILTRNRVLAALSLELHPRSQQRLLPLRLRSTETSMTTDLHLLAPSVSVSGKKSLFPRSRVHPRPLGPTHTVASPRSTGGLKSRVVRWRHTTHQRLRITHPPTLCRVSCHLCRGRLLLKSMSLNGPPGRWTSTRNMTTAVTTTRSMSTLHLAQAQSRVT